MLPLKDGIMSNSYSSVTSVLVFRNLIYMHLTDGQTLAIMKRLLEIFLGFTLFTKLVRHDTFKCVKL